MICGWYKIAEHDVCDAEAAYELRGVGRLAHMPTILTCPECARMIERDLITGKWTADGKPVSRGEAVLVSLSMVGERP